MNAPHQALSLKGAESHGRAPCIHDGHACKCYHVSRAYHIPSVAVQGDSALGSLSMDVMALHAELSDQAGVQSFLVHLHKFHLS